MPAETKENEKMPIPTDTIDPDHVMFTARGVQATDADEMVAKSARGTASDKTTTDKQA